MGVCLSGRRDTKGDKRGGKAGRGCGQSRGTLYWERDIGRFFKEAQDGGEGCDFDRIQ